MLWPTLKSLNSLFLNISKVSFPHKVWSNNSLWSPAGLVGTNHYVNTLKHKISGHDAPKEEFVEPFFFFFGTVVKFSTLTSSPVRDDKFIGFLMTELFFKCKCFVLFLFFKVTKAFGFKVVFLGLFWHCSQMQR